MKRVGTALMLLALLAPIGAGAGEKPAEKPAGKISGYMFGDYYWVLADHLASAENQNGIWFRRIYLSYDKGLSEAFAVRARFEASSPDFTAKSDKLNPFLKDAYLKWTRGRHSVVFGLSPSPTWERIEAIWGYRAVEKTPLDLQKFGGSRDLGVAVQGALDADKKLLYHFMIGNGSDTKSETNEGKKLYLSLAAKPAQGVTIEVYGDWENRPDDTDWLTLQGFASCERDKYRAGVHFAQQTRKQGAGADDLKLELLSLFGARQLSEKAWAFGRVDRTLDPIPDSDKISYVPFAPAKSTLLIAGADLRPIPEVRVMPNAEVVLYSKTNGVKPDTDVIPRLTVYYVF
jgi:hypothetical protein